MTFNIQRNVCLAAYNMLGFEVMASYFCRLQSEEDMADARDFVRTRDLPWLLIGGGSNLVLTEDFRGLVMHMEIYGRHHPPTQSLVQASSKWLWEVGAGENWDRLVAYTIQVGFGGLENLSLIPGTVGAAPVQNIGAYGRDVSGVVEWVRVFDFDTGNAFQLGRDDCEFGYRDSVFKRNPAWLITKVCLRLAKQPPMDTSYGGVAAQLATMGIDPVAASSAQVRQAVVAIRQAKLPDPKDVPNVGSFFKNPLVPKSQVDVLIKDYPDLVFYAAQPIDGELVVKLAAGWLIDRLGWKGHVMGGVGVHVKQALVLVRTGRATGHDLLTLARQIQADVSTHFGVNLEIEPRVFNGIEEVK